MKEIEKLATDYILVQATHILESAGGLYLADAYESGFRKAKEMAFEAIGKRIHMKEVSTGRWAAYVDCRDIVLDLGESEILTVTAVDKDNKTVMLSSESFRENRICDDCEKDLSDVEVSNCPYQQEVNDSEVECQLCAACYQERRDSI